MTTRTFGDGLLGAPRAAAFEPGAALASVLDLSRAVAARARSRHALAALDDRLLADIGLSRDVAAAEAHKRFWQA